MLKNLASLAAFFLALAMPANMVRAEERGDVIVRHVNVVDVAGERIAGDQAVVTRGDDIVAVGPDAAIASQWQAGRSIDGSGKYLIPGLWDMHVHFGGGPELIEENKALLPLYVAHGITTIRDASGDLPDQVLSWREEIANGSLFGPTLYTSGPKIEGLNPIWKGTIEAGSREGIDAALARLQALRVDFVKITDSTLQPELFLYALSRARDLGLRTSGHIPMALTVGQAIDAGLSSIEHLDYAFKAGAPNEAEIAAAFAAEGVFVTPTLNGSRIIAWLDQDDHSDDPYLALIGPRLRATYAWRVERAAGADVAAIEARHAHFDRVASVLPMLQRAGVTIMAGTDAGFLNSFNYPGIGLHDELALFVDRGLTPAQALASATRAGPAWFGTLDRFGSVAPGMAADLALLSRNPLEDIGATREIDTVLLRGEVFDRTALDRMLAETRARVAQWNAEAADGPAE